MEPEPEPNRTSDRWTGWLLWFAAIGLSLLPLSLLGVARCLTPADQGLGTHQQLGLPPCSMRLMFGMRCPACGMTTSWAHFTRGHWVRSIQSNSGGFLLAILAVVAAPVLLRAAWTSAPPRQRTQNHFIIALIAVAAVAIADWGLRLWRG